MLSLLCLLLFFFFSLVHTNNVGKLLSFLEQCCGLSLTLLFLVPLLLHFYWLQAIQCSTFYNSFWYYIFIDYEQSNAPPSTNFKYEICNYTNTKKNHFNIVGRPYILYSKLKFGKGLPSRKLTKNKNDFKIVTLALQCEECPIEKTMEGWSRVSVQNIPTMKCMEIMNLKMQEQFRVSK